MVVYAIEMINNALQGFRCVMNKKSVKALYFIKRCLKDEHKS